MIEVNIHITSWTNKKSGIKDERYTSFEVKGHANDGSMNSIKVCACITSIASSIPMMSDNLYETFELRKGYFLFKSNVKPKGTGRYHFDKDVQSGLLTFEYVLLFLKENYPSLFKSFNIIEERMD